jgi:hypothetical protein
MEWEKKKVMCDLGQEDDLEPFKEYVNQNIDTFDIQAWDMFITVFSIEESNIQKHSGFLKNLLPRLEVFDDEHGNTLSMRSNIRLGILISRIKECIQ